VHEFQASRDLWEIKILDALNVRLRTKVEVESEARWWRCNEPAFIGSTDYHARILGLIPHPQPTSPKGWILAADNAHWDVFAASSGS
jgi:hypothetical protein